MKKNFNFSAIVWIYPAEHAAWHFITVPKTESSEIKKNFEKNKRGWGSLPVEVIIGKTKWKTSIFPDKKMGAYVLPLKGEVRKKEKIEAENKVKVKIKILVGK